MPSGYVPEPLGGGELGSVNRMLADPAFSVFQRGGPAALMAPLINELSGRWGSTFDPYASAAGFPQLGDIAPAYGGSAMEPRGGSRGQGQDGALSAFGGGGLGAMLPSADQLARSLPRIGVQGIRCDVTEKDTEYVIHAEVPGVPKDKLRVEVDKDNRVLRIDASTSRSKERDRVRGGVRYHLSERSAGEAYRCLALPFDVDLDTPMMSTIEHGVLTLAVPKCKAGAAGCDKVRGGGGRRGGGPGPRQARPGGACWSCTSAHVNPSQLIPNPSPSRLSSNRSHDSDADRPTASSGPRVMTQKALAPYQFWRTPPDVRTLMKHPAQYLTPSVG